MKSFFLFSYYSDFVVYLYNKSELIILIIIQTLKFILIAKCLSGIFLENICGLVAKSGPPKSTQIFIEYNFKYQNTHKKEFGGAISDKYEGFFTTLCLGLIILTFSKLAP